MGADAQLRQDLINYFHNDSPGGHSGVNATVKRIGVSFYWKKMRKHVKQFIRECVLCHRPDLTKYPGLLQPIPIPSLILSQDSNDFGEGLPLSGGKSVIMVVVEKLNKYGQFMSLAHPNKYSDKSKIGSHCGVPCHHWTYSRFAPAFNAAQVATLFNDNVYKLYWLPKVYVKLQPHRQVTLRGSKQHKMSSKYYGPFKIEALVGALAYKLTLPSTSQIHPVFHFSQLKLHKGSSPANMGHLP
ncbi:uncharacterized protein [Rutidosis leptorrhynchoides]|uniref:uncharacterized protein n=1 Tax=Rutidosis leptorrhynchoides TaxID=125765 RepID=UPI003A99FD1E